jgi:hypothetical protein
MEAAIVSLGERFSVDTSIPLCIPVGEVFISSKVHEKSHGLIRAVHQFRTILPSSPPMRCGHTHFGGKLHTPP